jgi:hypothetical protein
MQKHLCYAKAFGLLRAESFDGSDSRGAAGGGSRREYSAGEFDCGVFFSDPQKNPSAPETLSI